MAANCRALRAEQARNGDTYSYVVKHLPEMCLGLCNIRTWLKEDTYGGTRRFDDAREKCLDVPIRLFLSSLMIRTLHRYTSPTGTFRLIRLDSPRLKAITKLFVL